jgi:eukaryotic-like serine/threonine-protein kinase
MTESPNPESSAPESIVREVIEQWRGGARPDAATFLLANPEIRERKSLAMDLIYEEYCLRNEAGETLVPSTFCKKFPTYHQSLQRLIDVHQFLDAHPEVAEEKKWRWPESGDTVLGFKIIQKLGEGAIAKVYLAQQPDLGQRMVVIKISRNGATEAKLLGKLEHPSIVPVHSVHQDEASGLTCICMPFLGTATLVDLHDLAFSKGQPPESAEILMTVARQYRSLGTRDSEEPPAANPTQDTYVEGVVRLGVQLAEALAAAHAAGIMHRDIKPSNVLLSRSGRPMLLDFNLSTDLEMPLERVGGTVAYMAPERIRCLIANDVKSESKIDPRSDVYSLAAVLYELLSGDLPSRPQAAPGKQARLEEWLKGRLTAPPSLATLNPQVDSQIDQVLLRALSPTSLHRFTSAAEFAQALQRTLAFKARAARFYRQNRRALIATAVGMLATVTVAAAVWASGESYEDRLLRLGKEAYERGEYKAAIGQFDKVLAIKPKDAAVLFARGQAYRQQKEWALAERDYLAAFDKTGNAELLFYVGHCELKQNYFDAAMGNYKRAIGLNWTSPQMLHNMAYCRAQQKKQSDAISMLEKLLAEHPNQPLALSHFLLARTQYLMIRSKRQPLGPETIVHLKKALQGLADDPLPHLDGACIYMREGPTQDEPAALECLRRAIALGASKFAVDNQARYLGTLPQQLSDAERLEMTRRPQTGLSGTLCYEPSPRLGLPATQ